MQPEALAEARAWFQKAAIDLRGAEVDLAASPPLLAHRQRDLPNHRCPWRQEASKAGAWHSILQKRKERSCLLVNSSPGRPSHPRLRARKV